MSYVVTTSGLPPSGKMNFFPGQGKVSEFHFQSGKLRKMKSQVISKFSPKMLINRLLDAIYALPFLIFMI